MYIKNRGPHVDSFLICTSIWTSAYYVPRAFCVRALLHTLSHFPEEVVNNDITPERDLSLPTGLESHEAGSKKAFGQATRWRK